MLWLGEAGAGESRVWAKREQVRWLAGLRWRRWRRKQRRLELQLSRPCQPKNGMWKGRCERWERDLDESLCGEGGRGGRRLGAGLFGGRLGVSVGDDDLYVHAILVQRHHLHPA